ncbi:hypothetical protein [Salipaludibacillus aurantiacus]|uniref:Uncharacterized protein n=1 Tax=Salipaludibacillus aurantiacus TaxID=1601833 RepID=A0A1H9WQT5_9BACI|nr:hypothetical protein [Salipaludibacillus aurantiacus]SES35753.1 hypothetical protein SAMN05518684_11883 [Salipaludibacillus aurantiacus]
MMKTFRLSLFIILLLLLLISGLAAGKAGLAAEPAWYEHSSLKVTIETETKLYEWEYENPDEFEYEEGHTIWRGDQAKQSFEHLLTIIDLTKPVISDHTAEKLSSKYEQIERITVTRIDSDNCIQTWFWNKGEGTEEALS